MTATTMISPADHWKRVATPGCPVVIDAPYRWACNASDDGETARPQGGGSA